MIPARFMDGRTARVRPLGVVVQAQFLQLIDLDGETVEAWPLEQVRTRATSEAEVSLGLETNPEARLVIRRSDVTPALRQFAQLDGRRGEMKPWLLLACGIPVLVALYFLFPLAVKPIAAMVPVAWEQRFGDTIAQSFDARSKACAGQDGQKALERLVQRIATAGGMPMPNVKVLAESDINAFALPGNHVRILSGLLDFARTPEEVAGVLAHEMAHVRQRHVTQNMVRSAGLGLIVSMLTGDASGLSAGAVHLLISLSYSRDDEAEADRIGIDLLRQAGIATSGMESFFKRMAAREGSGLSFLSTHPDSMTRARSPETQGASGGSAMSNQEFAALKAICR
jgi:predicted Zn-dependent protease